MRLLFFGTYDAAVHPRVQVLKEGFVALGDEVVEANVPVRVSTWRRVELLRRPWKALALLPRLAAGWLRLAIRARRLGPVDAVIVGYLGHFDIHIARLLFPRTRRALDHLISGEETALDRGAPSTALRLALRTIDRAAVRAADVPFVDTDEHLALLPDSARRRAEVVAVGAPAAWGDTTPADDQAAVLRVVYFGLFTPLHGTPVIAEAISLLAGNPLVRFTMVGLGQELESARELAAANHDVTWIDWVAAESLPLVVADHHVCLGIFGTGPKAQRVVPNKVFQGARAGCAVITSDTPPQRRAMGDGALYVPAGDAKSLAETISSLAVDRVRLDAARRQAVAAADRFGPADIVVGLRDRLLRSTP
jgi:glycosyltransferase involved in cell wall biosynthesis